MNFVRGCALCSAAQKRGLNPVITYVDITLDPASHVITLKEAEVMLSRREFALLQKLLGNAGPVISREQLNQTLYGVGKNIDSNVMP